MDCIYYFDMVFVSDSTLAPGLRFSLVQEGQ